MIKVLSGVAVVIVAAALGGESEERHKDLAATRSKLAIRSKTIDSALVETSPDSSSSGILPANIAETQLASALPGIAAPARHAQLAAPLNAIVSKILVAEGQRVRKGDILAVMDNRVAQSEVRVAEAVTRRKAGLERAKTEVRLAEDVLSRLRSLTTPGAVSEVEMSQAIHRRSLAMLGLSEIKEKILESELQLDLARVRHEAHNVRAPFDGLILQVEGRVGEAGTSAQYLVHIVDLQRLRVSLHVPIQFYDQLEVGRHYELLAETPVNKVVSAMLVSKDPIVNAGTLTFRSQFEIDNDKHRYPAGFSARLVRPNRADASAESSKPE